MGCLQMPKITTSLYGDLHILPYPAIVPVNEVLEWKTDVFESLDGTEDRIQLRSMPRQSFSYSIHVTTKNIQASFNSINKFLREKWAIPIWTEMQYVGEINETKTEIKCVTSCYDLRNDSLAMLYDVRCGDWQVIEILTVSSNHITCKNNFKYMKRACLLPLRVGYIVGDVNKETNYLYETYKINYFIEDNLYLDGNVPPQYLGYDVCLQEPVFGSNDTTKTFNMNDFINDNMTGVVSRYNPVKLVKYYSTYGVFASNAEEVRDYKLFLYRLSGMLTSFWLPTFEVNFRKSSEGYLTNKIKVKDDGYFENQFRNNIGIESRSRGWFFAKITQVVPVAGGNIELTLDNNINADSADVLRISYIGLYRSISDSFQLKWSGNNVMQSEFGIVEIEQ